MKEKKFKEKPDEVDNFFKKILKKEREVSAKEVLKHEEQAKDNFRRDELSEEEKQRILAAVENDQQVLPE